jgi:hypothetical protein
LLRQNDDGRRREASTCPTTGPQVPLGFSTGLRPKINMLYGDMIGHHKMLTFLVVDSSESH